MPATILIGSRAHCAGLRAPSAIGGRTVLLGREVAPERSLRPSGLPPTPEGAVITTRHSTSLRYRGSFNRRTNAVLAKLRRLAKSGSITNADYGHIELLAIRARSHDVLSSDRDRRVAAEERAKAILRRGGRHRDIVAGISRAMNWHRVRKRNLMEIAYSYCNLTEVEGDVPIQVMSGPRAPLVERVKGCPISPADAIRCLRVLYEANSDDAMLKDLHRAKKLAGSPLAGKRLPHRWRASTDG